MTNLELINKLKHLLEIPTIYYSGPNWSEWNGISWNFDCVVMIKSILFWGWKEDKNKKHGGSNYNSNNDYTCDQLLNQCSGVTTDFNKIERGELVCMLGNNHVGVYIGDGHVIEATAAWDKKVQMTNIDSSGRRSKNGSYLRNWSHHGKLPTVIYDKPVIEKLPFEIGQVIYPVSDIILYETVGYGNEKTYLLKKNSKSIVYSYHDKNGRYMSLKDDKGNFYPCAWTKGFDKFTTTVPVIVPVVEKPKPVVSKKAKAKAVKPKSKNSLVGFLKKLFNKK